MKHNALILTRVLHEFGIQPAKKLPSVPEASRFMVDNPLKLHAYGIRGVKRGDRVQVVNLGNGKWRIEHLSTGNSVTSNIRHILGGRRQLMFSR